MSDQQLIRTFGPSEYSLQGDIRAWIEAEKPIIESVNIAGGGNTYRPSFMTTILYRERLTQQE